MKCFYCKNDDVVKRGITSVGTQRYKCNSCKRTFTEKNQKTKIPFEFIALMLHIKAWLERNGCRLRMKEFILYTEQYISATDLNKKEIPRRTLYYWINTYGESYKKISHKKALRFFKRHRRESTQNEIELNNVIHSKEYKQDLDRRYGINRLSHKDYLKGLRDIYGVDGAKIILDGEWLKNKKKN